MIFAGLAFWFIRYQYDQNAKERTAYIERDEANDKRSFELAHNCNEAMSKLAQAVEMNTKAIEQNGRDDVKHIFIQMNGLVTHQLHLYINMNLITTSWIEMETWSYHYLQDVQRLWPCRLA